MIEECERCKHRKECKYYGSPPNVDKNKMQNGEWLCIECVPLRAQELDDAIATMRELLGKPPTTTE